MVLGNYNVEEVVYNGEGCEVELVSGVYAMGADFNEALENAIETERKSLEFIAGEYEQTGKIVPVRNADGLFVEFFFNDGTPNITLSSDGSFTDVSSIIGKAYETSYRNKTKESTRVKPHTINIKESDVKKCMADKKYIAEGGEHSEVFKLYMNKLTDIKALHTVNEHDVKCILKDGRVGVSQKGRSDEPNIQIGVLWAYVNAKNSAPADKEFEDILDKLFKPENKAQEEAITSMNSLAKLFGIKIVS